MEGQNETLDALRTPPARKKCGIERRANESNRTNRATQAIELRASRFHPGYELGMLRGAKSVLQRRQDASHVAVEKGPRVQPKTWKNHGANDAGGVLWEQL